MEPEGFVDGRTSIPTPLPKLQFLQKPLGEGDAEGCG